MEDIKKTAIMALEKLQELGAAKAQCYVEQLIRTELRVVKGQPSMLRSIDEQKAILTAIDNESRVGKCETISLDDGEILTAANDCIAFMKAAKPDESTDIAEVTGNGDFTAGSTECDVKGMIEYTEKMQADDAKKEKVKHDDDFEMMIAHYHKRSAIVNSNGVELSQDIGWYDINETKIPDLTVDIHGFHKFDKPYDSKKWAETEAEQLPEKFVGTVMLMPYGVWHLWWLTRMCVVNDFTILTGMDPKDYMRWINAAGKQMISDKLSIEEHPLDPRLAGIDRFTSEGYPTKDIVFFKNGVAVDFPLSQMPAKKLGRECNAAPHDAMKSGRQLFIKAGETPVADMLKNIKRGVILASFHCAPDNDGNMTGVIHDALLVENGEIVKKVHCMVSCDFYETMNNVSAVSRELQFNGEFETPWIAFEGVHIS